MKKERQIRQSNFELLRIIAMLLIVSHHLFVHGIFHHTINNASILDKINNFIFQILSSGGKIGVALFVLITGYFSSNKEFNFKKILHVYLQTLFYSLLIFFIMYFVKFPQINIYKEISFSLFPIGKNLYWFISVWVLLMIFSPVFNYILKSVNPEIIKKYLIFLTFILFILPSFKLNYGGSNFLLFAYLYMLGGGY